MNYAYYEVQYFPWWVYPILILALAVVLMTWLFLRGNFFAKSSLTVAGGLLVVAMVILRMTTYIDERSLTVSFGWIPVLQKTLLLSDIQEVQACTYHPLKQFGGWGWRYSGDGTHALTARGTQGICLQLQDGRKFIVGSSKSEELMETLRQEHVDPEVD